MIVRKRTKPLPLQKLEAAIPRLPAQFPKLQEMKKDMAQRQKGYIGERNVDYFIKQLAKQFTMIPNVGLRIFGDDFQIDTLILTRHAGYIIDTKNYNGTITFDTILKQLIRNDGEKETGYRYPITQAENQKLKLQNWLQHHNLPQIPIYFFIAISEPSTIIKVNGDQEQIAKIVAHGEHVPNMLMEVDKALAATGRPIMNMKKVGSTIVKNCNEHDIDIIGKYRIKPCDIRPGVQCPSCGLIGMKRTHGKWLCKRCGNESKYAHRRAIADYFLLIKPSITNVECRQFLKLDSRASATRILRSSGLTYKKEQKIWIRK